MENAAEAIRMEKEMNRLADEQVRSEDELSPLKPIIEVRGGDLNRKKNADGDYECSRGGI